MNLLYGVAIIASLNFLFLLSGYALIWGVKQISCPERMATALLAGLAWILLIVSVIGCFAPLGSPWLLPLFLPALVTLLCGKVRRACLADLKKFSGSPMANGLFLGAVVFLAALMLPLLSRPGLVFFEGSGNHDNIFWATGAEYLIRESYLHFLPPDLPAFLLNARNYVGWKPGWGRMGTEGYLALAPIFTGQRVIYSYNWSAAALYFPWLAAIFLVLKLFLNRRPGFWVLLAAILLQPVFGFFLSNGNLPNLMGALMGGAVLIAIHQGLNRAPHSSPWPWWIFLALAVHGLLCSYPEMVPFVGFPGLLLLVSMILRTQSPRPWRRIGEVTAAGTFGFLINPVSTIRAYYGFLNSFVSARQDQQWGSHSLFDDLHPLQYLLFLVTSATKACPEVNLALAGGISFLLLLGTVLAIIRSPRPLDTVALFSGYAVLLAYTFYSGFGYGLQKTVQFSGVIIGAFFPAACLLAFWPGFSPQGKWRRMLGWVAIAALIGFFSYATIFMMAYTYRSASRKYITGRMLVVGKKPAGQNILVVSEAFPKAYFWTMWANYFLSDSKLAFTTLTREPAGNLAEAVVWEKPGNLSKPEAYFVSDKWAESMDANSPKISSGEGYALLSKSNRVVSWKGADMSEGMPSILMLPSELVLVPHKDAWLRLVLRPYGTVPGPVRLRVSNQIPGAGKTDQEIEADPVKGAGILVKLTGGVTNTIAIESVSSQGLPAFWDLLDYTISDQMSWEP